MIEEGDFIDEASAYALGLLDGDDYVRAARRVGHDPAMAADVARVEAMLAPLSLRLPPAEVPETFFAALERRMDDVSVAAATDCRFVPADGGIWEEVAPGVRIKTLHRMPEIRRRSFLLELAPNTVADTHGHDDDEECYVISGDIWFGDLRLGPGDYHLASKGARHGTVRSQGGCRCLIIAAFD